MLYHPPFVSLHPATVFVAAAAVIALVIGVTALTPLGNPRPAGQNPSISVNTGLGGSIDTTTVSACEFAPPTEDGRTSPSLDFETVSFSYLQTASISQQISTTSSGNVSSGTANPAGVITLSNNSGLGEVRASIGALAASYQVSNTTRVVGCGFSYCSGPDCVPSTMLKTSMVNETVVYPQTYCNIEVCQGPGTRITLSLKTTSPTLSPGVPYTFRVWLEDGQGNYVAWVELLTYVETAG